MLPTHISRAALPPHPKAEISTQQTQQVHSCAIPSEVTASWGVLSVPHRGQGEGSSPGKLRLWSSHLRLCCWRRRGMAMLNQMWAHPHQSHDPPCLTCGTYQPLPRDVNHIQMLGIHMHWGSILRLIKKKYKMH